MSTPDPQLAKLMEEAEEKDRLDVHLAVQIAQYVREEMQKIEAGMTDKMRRIEDRIGEQVRTALNTNASTVKRMDGLENAFEDLRQDLVHTRTERANKELKEAEARYKIALEHKDGLSTQERLEMHRAVDDKLDARERDRIARRRAWWNDKVMPGVVTALIIAVVAPVGLGVFILVLVFILRSLGVEVSFPT